MRLPSALLSIALTLLGFSASATAQNLGYCANGECECTPTEATNYDFCLVTTTTVDPLEIPAMRDKIDFVLNGTSGLPKIEASVDLGTIFQVNRYNGDWPSVSTLEDYLNALVYGPDGASGTPFDPIDICDIPGLMPTVGGDVPRFDPTTDDWATFQTRDVLWAAISSDDGEIRINGETVWNTPVFDPTNLYCETGQDGALEARICSVLDEVRGAENEAVDCSPEFGSPGPVIPRAMGRIDQIKVDGRVATYETDVDGTFEVKMMTADYLELVDVFYLNGNPFPQGAPATDYDKPGLQHPLENSDGVCTDGDVWEGGDPLNIVSEETRNGSAPGGCHGDIEQ